MSDKIADIAIGISYSVQCGDGRNMVFQTAAPLDADAKARNGVLDKLRTMADRQVKFGLMESLQASIEENKRLRDQTAEGIADIDATYAEKRAKTANGRDPISKAEETARANAVRNVKHHEKAIATVQAKLEEIRSGLE